MMILSELFKNKNCFKLICGAGNEDTVAIERLVALYAKAGCRFFDVCAKKEVIQAAKQGLKRVNMQNNCYICISIGSESDQHFCKAKITNKCSLCGKCINECPQNAISLQNNKYIVNSAKCIGCKKCIDICPANNINLIQQKIDYKKLLPSLIECGIDCIEFHVAGDENDLYARWKEINMLFDGTLSISINRAILGDIAYIQTIKNLIATRKPFTTIIQADGIPMSGGKDNYNATLQAISSADIVKSQKLPVYTMVSGGTNSKTYELAKMCEVDIDGIAIGSFARKIVKDYTCKDDFWTNKNVFDEALKIATGLVNYTDN